MMAATTAIDPNKPLTLNDPLGVGATTSTQQQSTTSTTAPAPAPAATGMIGAAPPPPAPGVNFATDTVEGRVGNLLHTNDQGAYDNPLVRQATDRQAQAFNARGLLNTSMAQQAGQEAAISKALDIAAPDAQTYAAAGEAARGRDFQGQQAGLDRALTASESQASRTFQGGQSELQRDFQGQQAALDRAQTLGLKQTDQDFTLRTDYRSSLDGVNSNYQKMLDTINASAMTPDAKNVAQQQAAAARDGELAYINNVYKAMPQWQSEWLAMAVPTSGLNITTTTGTDTLQNIINDPAQPPATRAAAQQQLTTLGGGGMVGAPATPPAPGAPPPPAPGPSGSNIPDLTAVNLADPMVQSSLRAQGIWDDPQVVAARHAQGVA